LKEQLGFLNTEDAGDLEPLPAAVMARIEALRKNQVTLKIANKKYNTNPAASANPRLYKTSNLFLFFDERKTEQKLKLPTARKGRRLTKNIDPSTNHYTLKGPILLVEEQLLPEKTKTIAKVFQGSVALERII
jgi:hypothetical protein